MVRISHFLSLFLLFPPLFSLQVGGLTYLATMKPGETTQFSIPLISDKPISEMVDFALSDYGSDSEGHHFFTDMGTAPRSCAKWISLSSHRETLKPEDKREFIVTLSVPQDPKLQGSYWAVLLIEPATPMQTLSEPEQGFQLQVKVRYAYHIVVNVGQGTPSLKVVKKGLQEMGGKKWFAVDVENTGTLFLNPKMVIKLYDDKGILVKSMESDPERLYPASSSRFFSNGDNIAEGKYTAFLLLDNGDGKIFGDSFPIAFP